jgi:hypothetical protein
MGCQYPLFFETLNLFIGEEVLIELCYSEVKEIIILEEIDLIVISSLQILWILSVNEE